jgi:CheY-like chemotaxis protein
LLLYFMGSTSATSQACPGTFSTVEDAGASEWNQPRQLVRTPRAWLDGGSAPSASSPRLAGAASTRATEKKSRAFRILIADDHEAIRRGLRSALTSAGWQICGEALDGKEAIRQAAALKPDLVILDISMPNMGGLEAAREILRTNSETKVLIFTMHESRQIRAETEAIGVQGIAVKSAPLSSLLATIDSILRPS